MWYVKCRHELINPLIQTFHVMIYWVPHNESTYWKLKFASANVICGNCRVIYYEWLSLLSSKNLCSNCTQLMIQGWLLAGLYDVRICYILRRGTRDREWSRASIIAERSYQVFNSSVKHTYLYNLHFSLWPSLTFYSVTANLVLNSQQL